MDREHNRPIPLMRRSTGVLSRQDRSRSERSTSESDGASPTENRPFDQQQPQTDIHLERTRHRARYDRLALADIARQGTYVGVLTASPTAIDHMGRPMADSMSVTGPGPAPLRGIPGFQNQQPRAAPVNPSRMPNGKLGMSWQAEGDFSLPPWLNVISPEYDERTLLTTFRWGIELGIWPSSRTVQCRPTTRPDARSYGVVCTERSGLTTSDTP